MNNKTMDGDEEAMVEAEEERLEFKQLNISAISSFQAPLSGGSWRLLSGKTKPRALMIHPKSQHEISGPLIGQIGC